MSFINDLQRALQQNVREYGMFIALFVIMGIFTATTAGKIVLTTSVFVI